MKKIFLLLLSTLLSSNILFGASSSSATQNGDVIQSFGDKDPGWSNVQNEMEGLNLDPLKCATGFRLLDAQLVLIAYKAGISPASLTTKLESNIELTNLEEDLVGTQAELLNMDDSNQGAVCQVVLDFSNFWVNVLEERVGAADAGFSNSPGEIAFATGIKKIQQSTDVSNQLGSWNKLCDDSLQLNLNGVLKEVIFTTEEVALFNKFKKNLSANVQEDNLNLVPIVSLLEQSCLYEYMNVLLTKREGSSSADDAAFNALQKKISQFLADFNTNCFETLWYGHHVSHPVSFLQIQIDMIDYENAIQVNKAK